jgi:hypothetical protein
MAFQGQDMEFMAQKNGIMVEVMESRLANP